MTNQSRRRRAGMVLGELLAVVAVLAALVMVAIFAFTRYAARARTSEALASLCRISTGAVNYFNAEHVDPNGEPLPRQFPDSTGPTPAGGCCAGPIGKCAGGNPEWTDDTWQALHFSMEHDHYYTYEFSTSGNGTSSVFSAIARGDLDCDGNRSFFWWGGAVHWQDGLTVNLLLADDELE